MIFGRKRPRKQETNQVIKAPNEVALMREAGALVADCFTLLRESIQVGVRLHDLDKMVSQLIQERGALPLYRGYQGNPPTHPPFPGVICASVNDEVCHGLPNNRVLREGDIVGIDIGLRHKGYCGDACVTFGVGTLASPTQKLLHVAEECLYKGIEAAQVGQRLGAIGVAIEKHARAHGYTVVRDWGGHGIGRELHEYSVPHTGPADQGPRLKPGMIFTIEPMICAGKADWEMLADGWTVVTRDHALSAQFEHTVHITPQGAEILTPWHLALPTTG